MNVLQKAVEDLYHYRDHYVENKGLDKAAQKNDDVKQLMDGTLTKLESMKGICTWLCAWSIADNFVQ